LIPASFEFLWVEGSKIRPGAGDQSFKVAVCVLEEDSAKGSGFSSKGNFRVQRVRLCWVEGRQQKKKKKKKKSLNSQREASSGREQSFANQLLQAA